MQIGHQLFDLAMGGNQIIVHVARMARRVAQARQTLDFGEVADHPPEAPRGAIGTRPAIGVHVLT
ncbi:hypothetical protein D3C83_271090 [compost metagenome]